MTIDTAIINLGPAERTFGLTFVALSRVRNLENMLIHYE
jgi:hypothetical protein